MTQNDVKTIFDGATDAQIKAILDLNSSDIGKAKKECDTLRTELDEAKNKVQSYETEIGGLRDSVDEAEKLKTRVEELQKAIDDRKAADEKAEREKAVSVRFDAACGDAKFLNDFTRAGLLNEFRTALESKDNAGKADKEIFEALTADRDNIFLPEGGIPGVVSSTGGGGTADTDNDIREIMGLAPLKN